MLKIIFFVYFLSFPFAYSAEKINVLNWWNYMSSKDQNILQKAGFNFQVIEYRSNEGALSKILSTFHKYDIVIVSNWVAEIINNANKIDNRTLKPVIKSRNYLSSTVSKNTHCLPYLWAATTFAYKKDQSTQQINTLRKLVELKEANKRIAVIDDSMEFIHRFFEDEQLNKCLESKENLLCNKKILTFGNKITPSDFLSFYNGNLGKLDAVYGRHGEMTKTVEKIENFEFALPLKRPVMGIDYVCILKNETRSKKRTKELKRFVEELTNKDNTNNHVKETHYFSPYDEYTKGLLPPKTERLYYQMKERLKKNKPYYIKPLSNNKIKVLNKLWKTIRFNKIE